MTESTVIRLSIKKSPLQTLYATGVSIEEGSLPSGYLHRIQNAVSEELTRLTSSHGLLEQRTELLRRLIEANGGHEQGETWADAVDRIIEIRRSHDAALDDQQRSTKEVLADTLAALQSCDGSTDPTDDNFADTVDWSVARFAGEVRHAAQCHAERACHKQGIVQPRSPYDRLVVQRGTGVAMYVDVYEILAAFDTGSSVLDHLVKKALAPGQRHAKDRAKDLEEIEWSATCARMENEVAKEKGGTEGDPVSLAEKRQDSFAKGFAEAFKDPKLGRAFHADLDDLTREKAEQIVEEDHVRLEAALKSATTTGRFAYPVPKARWASVAALIDGTFRAMAGTPEEPKKERFWADILQRVGTHRIGDFYVDLPGESCRAWGEGFLADPQGRVKAEPTEVESLFSAIVADDGVVAATGLTQTEQDAWAEVCCRISLERSSYVHEGTGALVVGTNPVRAKVNTARECGIPIAMWGEVVEWIKWRAALEAGASE